MNIPPITMQTGRTIGKGLPTYIIAEIGSNHDGDLERAKKLIRLAKEAGADAAKFQSFQADFLVNRFWKVNGNWKEDPAWEILQKLSLPEDWHYELAKESKKVGIDFLSTPFDLDRLQLLLDINVPAIKIASGDLTYHELIRAAGKSRKPIFLSTGHAILGEVEAALQVLWKTGCKDIVLLQCASIYPASFSDANIPAMCNLQCGFHTQVGYSDHTSGCAVPLGAVVLGACVIEKHLTDDKSRKGPDHPFALDVAEFTDMSQNIRNVEEALVGGTKMPRHGEEPERILARRAVYAAQDIEQGTVIRRDLVKFVRHAYPEGVPAQDWHIINGKKATEKIQSGQLITWDVI